MASTRRDVHDKLDAWTNRLTLARYEMPKQGYPAHVVRAAEQEARKMIQFYEELLESM